MNGPQDMSLVQAPEVGDSEVDLQALIGALMSLRKGDLSKSMALDIDGRPLEGESAGGSPCRTSNSRRRRIGIGSG